MAEPIVIPLDLVPRRKRIVVSFAGGGGSSIAIAEALGVHPDAALNHWPTALAVHQANYPDAAHYCADIFDTDPRDVLPGEEIGLAWFSPDCRHFSKAKGGTPVSGRVRGLAWCVIPWAKLRRPDVIMLENVEEFLTWGPLVVADDGRARPDPARVGETFKRWKRRLEACGYVVDWKVLVAADYGAPTIRKRLFIVARCDGRPIAWPAPTHAPRAKAAERGLAPYRAAAEIIDFSRPCPSIFLTREEAKALRVKRPLEEATLRRIAKGLWRYTIACAEPFIVPVLHAGDERTHDVREPLRTMTTSPRGEFALVAPNLVQMNTRDVGGAAGDPLRTATAKGHHAVAAANLIKFSENSTFTDPREPLHTIMAGAPRHGLVSAHLTKFRNRSTGADLRDPAPTITANSFLKRPGGAAPIGLAAAFMEQANTDMVGHDAREPTSTIVQKGCTQRLITAQLSHAYTSNTAGGEGNPRKPIKTVLAGGNRAYLLESILEADQPMTVPFGRERELRAFLVKYYGAATAEDLADPLATATSRSRFGLVMVAGVAWRIVDIGMRMLDPETELAAAMGVPASYVLGHDVSGRRITKTDVTKMVGNMVSPPPARALIQANCADLPWWREPKRMAA